MILLKKPFGLISILELVLILLKSMWRQTMKDYTEDDAVSFSFICKYNSANKFSLNNFVFVLFCLYSSAS